jgi:hypothetical protein
MGLNQAGACWPAALVNAIQRCSRKRVIFGTKRGNTNSTTKQAQG